MASETQVETVKVIGGHKSHTAGRWHYATPVGWAPAKPAKFADDQYIVEDGSILGDTEEEAAIVYFGEIAEDEEKAVPLTDLYWIRTGTIPTQNLGPVQVVTRTAGFHATDAEVYYMAPSGRVWCVASPDDLGLEPKEIAEVPVGATPADELLGGDERMEYLERIAEATGLSLVELTEEG